MSHARLAQILALAMQLSILGLVPACSKSALDRAAQKKTVAEIRNYGTLWLKNEDKWREIELVPGDEARIRKVEEDEATSLVSDSYFKTIPEDGWGRPLEVWFLELGLRRHLMLRSAGSDGDVPGGSSAPRPEDFREKKGGFPAAESGHDIVWVDGEFLTWPF